MTADGVWREYLRNKRLIRMIEIDAIYGVFGEVGMPHSQNVGRPTEAKAISLVTNNELQAAELGVAVVDYVLDTLQKTPKGDSKCALMIAVYIHGGATLKGMAAELGISEKTAGRWKRRAWELTEDYLARQKK